MGRHLKYAQAMQIASREIVSQALNDAGGCVAVAAQQLGVNRTAFYQLPSVTKNFHINGRSRYSQLLRRYAQTYVLDVLAAANWSRGRAAKIAGRHRTSFLGLIVRLDLHPPKLGRYGNRGQWDRPIEEDRWQAGI